MGKIPDELRESIASNIHTCRQVFHPGRGGSKKCAEEFGVSPQQWSPWERGMRTPDELRLQQISDFFGVKLEWMRRDNKGTYPGQADLKLQDQDPDKHSVPLEKTHQKWRTAWRNQPSKTAPPDSLRINQIAIPDEKASTPPPVHNSYPPTDCIAMAMYSRANAHIAGFLPPMFNSRIRLTPDASAEVGNLFHETRQLCRKLAALNFCIRIEVYCDLSNPMVEKAY